MRLPRTALIAIIAAIVLLSACDDDGNSSPPARTSTTTASSTSTTSSTSITTTTSSAPTTLPPSSVPVSALEGPRILRLTGPQTPVPCNAPTSIELHWETRDASTVTLRIDDEPIFATYGGGSNDKLVPLACDGNTHTYTLTAHAADGRTATRTLKISVAPLT